MGGSKSILGRSASILLLCCAGVMLQGCGTKPTRLEANVIAADDVNKDAEGRSLPIVVRLYELKGTGGFQDADFYGLYDHEADALGADLLGREELNLRPGQQQEVARATAPDAQFLGVVGAFNQIEGARWKATHPLKSGAVNKVEIDLGPNAVSIR